ncbi:MAG: DNA polymerase-1 [Gammaproteobacteria bacterium]|jgi:DNA polymerase-1
MEAKGDINNDKGLSVARDATVLVIDGLNLIRRVYAGVVAGPRASSANDAPPSIGTRAKSDDIDGFVESLRRSLVRAISDVDATHGLCVMDAPGPTWRNALHPEYKSKRPPMPQDLSDVLPKLEQLFVEQGVPWVSVVGMEADDVVASVALKLRARPQTHVIVLSTDKSLFSLLAAGVRVRNHFDRLELSAADVKARFGVEPQHILDWIALVGDRSQDIPGVPGVGAKTAATLINGYGTLEQMLAVALDAHGTSLDGTRMQRCLVAGASDGRLSRQLVELRSDVETGINLRSCRIAQTA